MPEVSLVAILDADKEGFLRSEGSLIQTIGRAARNINGKAILYADRITGSMQRAMDETERRRSKQITFNQEHNITPRTIQKAIKDVMEGARAGSPMPAKEYAEVAEEQMEYASMSVAEMSKKIKQLEQKMYQHARDLEFEDAAAVRDQLKMLQSKGVLA
jgi:excinuclease ABC subunit B